MENNKVSIVDIDIPFGRMVAIIFKWTLASIPVMIIIWVVMAVIMLIFGGIITGLNLF